MERIKECIGQRLMGCLQPRPPKRCGIRKRGLLMVFLPSAIIVAAGVLAFLLYSAQTVEARAARTVILACAAGAVVILVLWLLLDWFLRGITEPLRQLRSQAKRISEGSYGIRSDKLRDDELGDLTDSINEMSEEIAGSETLQTEFISSVSHELRTPLTAISGWAETLEYDEAIQGDSRRGIAIISREASRLTKMVGELLEFTRIQDGRFNLNIGETDIAAEVEDAVFTYSKLLQQEELELRYACDESTVPMIEGDSERLKQVLLNVIDNAAKYGRDGGRIEVSVKSDSKYVMIGIRDHGPGIPAEELPHVKEKFYKGSSRERGSGIGLAVCEEIVTRHGGVLWVENAEGGGVIVTITLPVRQ